jgi:hypothetical protein
MSLDYLQVSKYRTSLRAPDMDTTLNSKQIGVNLSRGLDVTDAGLITGRPWPYTTAEPQSLSSGLITISTNCSSIVRVANVVGSALQNANMDAGTIDGQMVFVVNGSAYAITFAAASTSYVADGVSTTIPANAGMGFTWSQYHSRWHKLG